MTIKQKQWQHQLLNRKLRNGAAPLAIRLLRMVNVSDNVQSTYDVVQT